MSIVLGPKLRALTPNETLSSLESWMSMVRYNLSLNKEFHPYLKADMIFGNKTRASPNRALTDRGSGDTAVSKEAQCIQVDMMLEQIANWADLIPRNDIVRDCTSLDNVWQVIRRYYNLETTGSLLNQAWNLVRQPDESPQALFSRLKQLYDNNLLQKGGLKHLGKQMTVDEEMTPTLYNTIVLHWLQLLHPKLRDLVTQRFSAELRDQTYASIFPEISRSVNDLLVDLETEASVMRTFVGNTPWRSNNSSRGRQFGRGYSGNYDKRRGSTSVATGFRQRNCEYCKLANRQCYQSHNMSECFYLNKENSKVFGATGFDNNEFSEEAYGEQLMGDHEDAYIVRNHVLNRVSSYASPVLPLYLGNELIDCTLDSGATCNTVRTEVAKRRQLPIRATNQTITLADGNTSLDVVGETDVTFYRDGRPLHMLALVVNESETEILCGMPFLTTNDIALRPARNEIIIAGEDVVTYDPVGRKAGGSVRKIQSYDIVSHTKRVILPGEVWSVKLPAECDGLQSVAVEPRFDTSNNSKTKETNIWPPPQVVEPVEGIVSLSNLTSEPIVIKRSERVCKVVDTCEPSENQTMTEETPLCFPHNLKKVTPFSTPTKVNPDKILSPSTEVLFKDTLLEYDNVFNPRISCYNGHSGPCAVEVNMGPTKPPQRKGRVPMYSKSNLDELQRKFDELESKGVFGKPQKLGVKVEYVNPSFLVKKSSGDFRLVTDFSSIAPFTKPAPTLLPDVNSTLLKIGSWKYLIKSDFAEAYFQLCLKRNSMRYCGVATPYKGTRVYMRGCMGLPGTETALEELTCLVLGDLVMLGFVSKLADDLYIGGDTETELLQNFRLVLHRLQENNLTLSARKTVIAPRSTDILGWTWSGGKLQASSHRISALAACGRPDTVTGMRSFLGTYKHIARVIKDHAVLLEPLESIIAGKDGHSKIIWSDELTAVFEKAQDALKGNRAITIPIPSDILWIVTDGSLKNRAIGATLYLVREGVTKLGGFFSGKVSKCQAGWLACEIEGIAISAALHHFAPLIRQSVHRPRVLTDSKPCVQACAKFARGEFSTSARLCTFLNSVGVYRAEVSHISGKSNIASDFASRTPVECRNPRCEMCKFVDALSESVVAGLSMADLETGRAKMPFTNPSAWLETQGECADLRQVKFCLSQGTHPGRKQKGVKVVRRYLSSKVMLNSKGLLVVRDAVPLKAINDRIVVPQSVVVGLLTSLHIQCAHPSAYQMKKIFIRYFFALDLDRLVNEITASCHQCAAIRDIPHSLIKQSTDPPPDVIGHTFAADIVRRHKQKIFVMRETVTSYTTADIVKDETVKSVTDAILTACSKFRPSNASQAIIRVDPASAHKSLFKVSDDLTRANIRLDVGRAKNVNKNPVVDKAIKELIREIQIKVPHGGPISPTTLDLAVASLNSRIRSSGLSAQELWTQRDQVSGIQLPIHDRDIIKSQNQQRRSNHSYSERCKAGGRNRLPEACLSVGDLVFVYSDGNKLSPRPRYIVVSIQEGWCKIKKMENTLFSSITYDMKLDEIYKVPGFDFVDGHCEDSDSDDDDSMVPLSWETLQDSEQTIPNPIPDPIPMPEPIPQGDSQLGEPQIQEPEPTDQPGNLGHRTMPPGSPITGPPKDSGYSLRRRSQLKAPTHLTMYDRE